MALLYGGSRPGDGSVRPGLVELTVQPLLSMKPGANGNKLTVPAGDVL